MVESDQEVAKGPMLIVSHVDSVLCRVDVDGEDPTEDRGGTKGEKSSAAEVLCLTLKYVSAKVTAIRQTRLALMIGSSGWTARPKAKTCAPWQRTILGRCAKPPAVVGGDDRVGPIS